MRSLISRTVAAGLALSLCVGVAAAQTSRKRKSKRTKTVAAQSSEAKPKTTQMQTQANTGDPVPPPQSPEPGDGVRRITATEAHEAWLKGNAIIVDVRNEVVYQTGHIKGAILIPADQIASQLNKLPRDKMIITYCT